MLQRVEVVVDAVVVAADGIFRAHVLGLHRHAYIRGHLPYLGLLLLLFAAFLLAPLRFAAALLAAPCGEWGRHGVRRRVRGEALCAVTDFLVARWRGERGTQQPPHFSPELLVLLKEGEDGELQPIEGLLLDLEGLIGLAEQHRHVLPEQFPLVLGPDELLPIPVGGGGGIGGDGCATVGRHNSAHVLSNVFRCRLRESGGNSSLQYLIYNRVAILS